MPSVSVVGAGVAGLTIGYQLARRGYAVTIVERNAVVGGLGRTFHYGDFHFDVGPHRFHTENPRVAAFIRAILGEEAIEIPRKSGARMFGKYHEWPLRPSILAAMPIRLMVAGGRDLVLREKLGGESFEADVVNKYGRTLYNIFFEPYTRKFLFHSPSELHRDWARAGVNRAVIDKRAQADNLWSLLMNTLMPKPVETMFLYPPTGVGRFSDRLAESIVADGGRILLGQDVVRVETTGRRITAVETAAERIPCDNVVWTAPLTALNAMLGFTDVDLEYLSTLFYNFEIGKPPRLDYQWTYFGGDEIFSRVTAPEAFLPSTVPSGKSGLCVEVTCRQGDERWRAPERLTEQVVADLVRTEMINSASDIERVHVEAVPFTYPIYKLNYMRELTRNLRELGHYSNLLLAGRCGRFWYNNMDHSIGQGLTMADKILRGDVLAEIDTADREFWVTEDDGNVPVRAEEIAELPEDTAAGMTR
ncbi:MAG TPA: FAD-dependent oxidoreductase [Vicinamibacterales bacterium]|nr:FAD-dependent oxidoreductase [Vicinamibacterales bacterium]